MYDERLAEFSRERLDGRPIPDDLRVLLVAQWEGRDDFSDLLDLDFLEAGEVHPLLDTSYRSEKGLANPEIQAVNAGTAEMAKYVKLVAEGGKGWIGYWLHPDEPTDPSLAPHRAGHRVHLLGPARPLLVRLLWDHRLDLPFP
ncbi:hypothetical protein [Streptomyces sp. NBC_01187]|uniref:hypothetical protein n=1 Tax=Streptomyces sp. NBC_01187 TaxID=2903766 RepID=UPI0038701620|nr:hypothetical protein OG220_01540 [Streptomyces sp. NBC_01187]